MTLSFVRCFFASFFASWVLLKLDLVGNISCKKRLGARFYWCDPLFREMRFCFILCFMGPLELDLVGNISCKKRSGARFYWCDPLFREMLFCFILCFMGPFETLSCWRHLLQEALGSQILLV